MIETIIAENFKGLSFNQPLEQANLFTGPNGSGKSARAQALIIALQGYYPEIGKKPASIYKAFATDKTMTVGFIANGQKFERVFSQGKSSTTQSFRIDGKKVNKDDFNADLKNIGIKIVDLKHFLELSDQKKIEWLFTLFPPSDDVQDLDNKIEAASEKRNELAQKYKELEGSKARLQNSRNELDLPNTTLSKVREEITQKEQELEQAREERQKAKQEEQAAQEAEKSEQPKPEQPEQTNQPGKQKQLDFDEQPPTQPKEPQQSKPKSHPADNAMFPRDMVDPNEVRASFQRILDTMNNTGCSACAASLVIKKEMKKYQPKEAVNQ